jgi:type I restriction enzyme S subunit
MNGIQLPKEWIWSSIDEFSFNENGARKPVSLAKRREISGEFPYYGATGQIDSLNNYTHDGEYILIGEDGANLLSKSKDLAFLVEGKIWVNNHAHALRCLANSPRIYLAQYINSLNLKEYVTGSAQPKLTKGNLSLIPVPTAPLAEQKEIANQLDSLLTKVDSIKSRLDAIPDIIKRFRQSVLASAVSGKLTEEWRERNNLDAPKLKIISELIESLDQGWSPKCENKPVINEEWGVIKTSAIQAGFFLNKENKKLPITLKAKKNLSISKGDVLITRAGPRVRCGVTCIVEQDYPKLMICDKVYRIRVKSAEILPQYLNISFNSPQYLKDIELLKTGSSDSGLNMTQKKLVAMELSTPHIQEQTKIVQIVEQLLSFADKVEHKISAAQESVNNLTQSILAKAFRGELTAEWRELNQALITGENSAEALLAKIKAEREALSKKKSPKKKPVKKQTTARKAQD